MHRGDLSNVSIGEGRFPISGILNCSILTLTVKSNFKLDVSVEGSSPQRPRQSHKFCRSYGLASATSSPTKARRSRSRPPSTPDPNLICERVGIGARADQARAVRVTAPASGDGRTDRHRAAALRRLGHRYAAPERSTPSQRV